LDYENERKIEEVLKIITAYSDSTILWGVEKDYPSRRQRKRACRSIKT
jgi:hypothetical protein